MRADLGMDVLASDGAKVGTIEKVVLDAGSMAVTRLVVHRDASNHADDALLDIGLLAASDANGLRLRVPIGEAVNLPPYRADAAMVPTAVAGGDSPDVPPGSGAEAQLRATGNSPGDTYDETLDDPLFAPVTPVAPLVEERSNLADTDVVIDKATEVFGADDEKVGHVREAIFEDDGQLIGFVVEKGWLFKHDMRVPREVIATVDNTQVRLNVPGAEAETRAYHVEDTTL